LVGQSVLNKRNVLLR